MIARHDLHTEKADIWSRLAEPLPNGVVYWRQDGKTIARDGKYFARFVAYIEANTARERLDAVVPGEWDLTLELLPPIPGLDDAGDSAACSFKARLQILGVIREDVGTGRDYKSAATDAFKRAAVRFGIAHELYAYEQNWVQVDGDGRYAKPLEDPQAAYTRRYGDPSALAAVSEPARIAAVAGSPASGTTYAPAASPAAPSLVDTDTNEQICPKCGGRMWDNRATKRNPKAPDFKCRDRACDGVIWPARANGAAPEPAPRARANGAEPLVPEQDEVSVGSDDLPF
jgi:hypothetical protein